MAVSQNTFEKGFLSLLFIIIFAVVGSKFFLK